MSAFDDLPADQRAVVELVLRSGRSYDQIAAILKIDRAGVRERALAALDALAPEAGEPLPQARRALITDYLLGQLPPRLAEQVRERLGHEDAERAWAATVAQELRPIAAAPLPEIPPASAEEPGPQPPAPAGTGPAPAGLLSGGERRSSRRGGAMLLALGGVVAIALIVLVIVLASSGGGNHTTSTNASLPTTTAATSATSGTTATAPGNSNSKELAISILTAGSSASKSKGAAEIISEKGQLWLFLVAVNLPPNSHNFYGVWLSNGPTDSRLVGFQTVGSNGRLAAFSPLTSALSSYAQFKRMLITLEPTASKVPKTPGTVVLSGPLNLK